MLLEACFPLEILMICAGRDKVDNDVTRNVQFIAELVKIPDNMLHMMSNDIFSLTDIGDIISFLCTVF